MISFTGHNGQVCVCGSQEFLGGKERETRGIKSIGTEFGMENTLRLKNLFSGNSFIFSLLYLKRMEETSCLCGGLVCKGT